MVIFLYFCDMILDTHSLMLVVTLLLLLFSVFLYAQFILTSRMKMDLNFDLLNNDDDAYSNISWHKKRLWKLHSFIESDYHILNITFSSEYDNTVTSQFPVTWHSLISCNIYYLFYLPLFSTFVYLLVCILFSSSLSTFCPFLCPFFPCPPPTHLSCPLLSSSISSSSLSPFSSYSFSLILLSPSSSSTDFFLSFSSLSFATIYAVNFYVPLLSPFCCCCCCCSSHQDRGIGSWRTRRDASVLLEELSALGEKHKLER